MCRWKRPAAVRFFKVRPDAAQSEGDEQSAIGIPADPRRPGPELHRLAHSRPGLGAYYTYEKDRTTNQWSTTTGANLNHLLRYVGTDETDTFGLNGMFQLKPEVWKLSINAMRQKVDGLMDITAREAGTFYTPGRTGLIPAGTGGAADINDLDDTLLTTVRAQLDYNAAESWTLSAGYWYEKYDFKDPYSAGTLLMPQSALIFLKSNDGAYNPNVIYGKLSYRF